MAESLTVQFKKIMDEYKQDVQDAANRAVDDVSKESVKKLKNTSPKKSGDYAKGWTVKKSRGASISEAIIHNKQYQLTHLLENGHRIVNKKGEWGRVNGIKHIKPVEEWASDELPKEIERELE